MALCLSNTTGYAVLALGFLERAGACWVQARAISAATSVPLPFLLKVLQRLEAAGLVRSKRGYRGGFCLGGPAGQITVWAIAQAIEGPEVIPKCLLGLAKCSDSGACYTYEFWMDERDRIEQYLRRTTLKDMADFDWQWRYQKSPCVEAEQQQPAAEIRLEKPARTIVEGTDFSI